MHVANFSSCCVLKQQRSQDCTYVLLPCSYGFGIRDLRALKNIITVGTESSGVSPRDVHEEMTTHTKNIKYGISQLDALLRGYSAFDQSAYLALISEIELNKSISWKDAIKQVRFIGLISLHTSQYKKKTDPEHLFLVLGLLIS